MRPTTRFSALLYRFSGWLRCRIINGHQGEPYLERYHLLRLPGGGGVYLHRFVASDPDRGLHDHPWPWALSWVLAGGYRELLLAPAGAGERVVERPVRPGRFNRIGGGDFHRVILPEGGEAWTLFMHAGKCKDWGFLQLDGEGRRRYRPHESVSAEGSHDHWWKRAPRGRALRRSVAAARA